MRVSRIEQNPESHGLVHKYWKCHNSEHLLGDIRAKNLYSKYTYKALKHKTVSGNVDIHAFCYMDNHVHMLCEYRDGVEHLSRFMRLAHGSFGLALNKALGRKGKVAIERPHTPQVEQGDSYEKEVQFYIEANPLRAGMVRTLKGLRRYRYSSYAYYAHGDQSEFTKDLTKPQWYLDLGKSDSERQMEYRKLFKVYLDTYGWVGKSGEREKKIPDRGSEFFLLKRKLFLKSYRHHKREHQDLSPRQLLELMMKQGPPKTDE